MIVKFNTKFKTANLYFKNPVKKLLIYSIIYTTLYRIVAYLERRHLLQIHT